jgi:4-amino-4-deoxy-L-arabinose transferase-like glycosyltransferase
MSQSSLVNTRYAIPVVIFVVSIMVYSYNLEGQPRHGDEINYLGWAGNYIHLVDKGDLANPCLVSIDNCSLLYHIPAHGTTYSPLRMVLIGTPLSITHQDTGDYYDWSCYWFSCYDFHHAPTIQQMAAGRILSPVFGALTIVVAFLVGKILFNRNVGIIFSSFFLFYNLWVWYSRTIMTEVHYIFFSMLALLLLLYSFRTGRLRIRYFVSSAIAYGCALTSKLLSVEFAILFAGIILFYLMRQSQQDKTCTRKTIRKIGIAVIVFFLVSIFGFLLTEPGFYKNPLLQMVSMKYDMDNYNRDVWFIAYPTIQGLHPIRMILLFNYALFPSPVNHTIPGAFPGSTFDLGWNSPPTYSSIPMTLFFFIGLGYTINKIRKRNDCIPEILLLVWFVSTFFSTLMIARDLSLERYQLPFLLSIVMITSYGIWNFVRHAPRKIQVSFAGVAIAAHAITSLYYWQELYFAPGTFCNNPIPYGTFQESIVNTPALAVNLIFLAFFAVVWVYRVRENRKVTV